MTKKKAPKTMTKAAQERRSVAVTLKGSEEWKEWVERASKHCRLTVSSFLDAAATEYAKMRGFTEGPPER